MTKNGSAPRRALEPKFAGTPPIRKPGLRPGVLEDPGEQRSGRGLAVRARDREHPALLAAPRGQPFRPRDIGHAALEQRLHHRLAARHDVADHDHVRRRIELRGLEAFDELDTERLELRAHRRVYVAIRAGDREARGRAIAATPPMNVPQMPRMWTCIGLLQALTGRKQGEQQQPRGEDLQDHQRHARRPDHSSAAFTTWLLAAISQASSSSPAQVTGNCQAASSPEAPQQPGRRRSAAATSPPGSRTPPWWSAECAPAARRVQQQRVPGSVNSVSTSRGPCQGHRAAVRAHQRS